MLLPSCTKPKMYAAIGVLIVTLIGGFCLQNQTRTRRLPCKCTFTCSHYSAFVWTSIQLSFYSFLNNYFSKLFYISFSKHRSESEPPHGCICSNLEKTIVTTGLEICGSNGSKCYHVFSFATGILMWEQTFATAIDSWYC